MSPPAASGVLRQARLRTTVPEHTGLFRLHPTLRRDVVAAACLGGVACLSTALLSLHFRPQSHTAATLALLLLLEIAVLLAASGVTLWSLGLAVQADPVGVRRFNLLFAARDAGSVRWEDLARVEQSGWALGWLGRYPRERICFVLRDGRRWGLLPLEEQEVLAEICRRRLETKGGEGMG
jgi:hypothetical protein